MNKYWSFLKEQVDHKFTPAIIGIIFTSVFAPFLNSEIQSKTAEYNRKFEMYQVRLQEAKLLQHDLLETMNIRLFWLEQTLVTLADSGQGEKKFSWPEAYIIAKNNWDTNMIYWHSKLDVLFGEALASELVQQDENNVIFQDNIYNNLKHKTHQPKTVHGAFADAHATVQYLLSECQIKESCIDRDEMILQAKNQIIYLKTMSDCFAHNLSGQLLVDPYGPGKGFELPSGCQSIFRTSSFWSLPR